jgi:hypothetical protein
LRSGRVCHTLFSKFAVFARNDPPVIYAMDRYGCG